MSLLYLLINKQKGTKRLHNRLPDGRIESPVSTAKHTDIGHHQLIKLCVFVTSSSPQLVMLCADGLITSDLFLIKIFNYCPALTVTMHSNTELKYGLLVTTNVPEVLSDFRYIDGHRQTVACTIY